MGDAERFVGVWELDAILDAAVLTAGFERAAGLLIYLESGFMLHHAEVAFVPNRSGRTVRRSYSFAGDSSLLSLSPIALSPDDDAPRRVLRWRRRRSAPAP